MTIQLSPAHEAGDKLFLSFARECQDVVDEGIQVQPRIAELTETFCGKWRMPDERYMQLQPDKPYASYLLYLSTHGDLSIVLDIFMAGQAAVAHNHLCWCVFGCVEGVELERLYEVPDDLSAPPREVDVRLRPAGVVTLASSAANAFHQVECAEGNRSVSLHLYGRDIGRIERLMWNQKLEDYTSFTGGYSNDLVALPVYAKL